MCAHASRGAAGFLRSLTGMNDDIQELRKKVLAMTSRVGRKTRYRLLEMHARLSDLGEDPPTPPAGGTRPLLRARARAAA